MIADADLPDDLRSFRQAVFDLGIANVRLMALYRREFKTAEARQSDEAQEMLRRIVETTATLERDYEWLTARGVDCSHNPLFNYGPSRLQ